MSVKERRLGKWYFGGIASAGAASVTHPLDLVKVQMQTQKGKNISLFTVAKAVVKKKGIMGLYNGISASLLRQITYSTARFGIYESGKQYLSKDGKKMSLPTSILLAALGGAGGGFVGNPADLVNVRMQNDLKLPPENRRNYKHALHGMYRVAKHEGVTRLWAGSSVTCMRAVLMNVGQISVYDEVKHMLLKTPYFQDNVITHFSGSLIAGAVATTLCQPFDVIKTRLMNAKPGEVKSIVKLITQTGKEGPFAFFKGYVPAFVRLAPQTILTFVFLEQLRLNFGSIKKEALIEEARG